MRRLVVATALTAVLLAVLGSVGRVGFTAGVTFSGSDESERYVGTDEADTMTGLGGKDFFRGGVGGDTLNGDADADTLIGDEPTDNGNDTISGGDGTDEVAGGPGSDQEFGGAGDDLMGSMDYRDNDGPLIEDLGNDTLAGEDGNDFLYAGPGQDALSGGVGVDNLFGGADADTLSGGPDDDLLNGEAGTDRAAYTNSGAGVTVDLTAGTATGGEGSDILQNVEDVSGSNLGDTISGSSATNVLLGQDGADTISGGAGRDGIQAGEGADTVKTRDNEEDRIVCGAGMDKVQADELDVFLPFDETTQSFEKCEIIDRSVAPPTTWIGSGPSDGSVTKATTVKFWYYSSDPGSTYDCRLTDAQGQTVQPTTDTCNSEEQTYDNLTNGTYTFEVKATDAFGETGEATASTFRIDTVASTAPVITSPANNSYDTDGSFTLRGTAEPDSTIKVFEGTVLKDEPVRASATGVWSKVLTGVANGKHYYKATATDEAGNVSPASTARTIIVDGIKPLGSVLVNGGAATTKSSTVTLSLKASDPAPASGMGQMRFSNNGTTWSSWQTFATSKSWKLTSGAGTKTVWVQYKDRAGNVSALYRDAIKYAP